MTKKTEVLQCVLCQAPLWVGGYIRQGGKPIMYAAVYYCDNNECLRYGLLSIYKLAKGKK